MQRWLRGDPFANRYRLTGTLKTISPLHIGSGEENPGEEDADGESRKITGIIKDGRGKPLIPGSALKGVMRHWLLDVLTGLSKIIADRHDYDQEAQKKCSQDERAEQVRQWSWLELLFGTPFHAGKIDVWDGLCTTQSVPSGDHLIGWCASSLTYHDVSVAIDPETGTAAEHLLYQAEVVPPGVTFEVNICGQNLSDLEVGMLLLALQGFNSQVYPETLGARGGRGYGRMQYEAGPVYKLDAAGLPAWIAAALDSYGKGQSEGAEGFSGQPVAGQARAGYLALPELGDQEQAALIAAAKAAFLAGLSTAMPEGDADV